MQLTHLASPSSDLEAWGSFLARSRAFFDQRDAIEVTTDCMVPAGAVEGTIDTIQVSFQGGTAELHTSAEIEMKRLLVKHPRAIYQICKCFRDDPDTGIHRKEFSMLEYYRPAVTYRETWDEIKTLIQHLAERTLAFQEISVRELILRSTGIDLDQHRNVGDLRTAIQAKQTIHMSPTDSWNDLFFKLMLEHGEASLPSDVPVVIYDYPLSISVLSAATPDIFWAERFEVYWHGLELCNGCTELVNANELRRRLEHENALRSADQKSPHPPPIRLLTALDAGIPPCSGVAIGLDRLFTCLQSDRQGPRLNRSRA